MKNRYQVGCKLAAWLLLAGVVVYLNSQPVAADHPQTCPTPGLGFDLCEELVVGFGPNDTNGQAGDTAFTALASQFDLLMPAGTKDIKITTDDFCHPGTTNGRSVINLYRVTLGPSGYERIDNSNNPKQVQGNPQTGPHCTDSVTWTPNQLGLKIDTFDGTSTKAYNLYYLEIGAISGEGANAKGPQDATQAYYNRFTIHEISGNGLLFARGGSWKFDQPDKQCNSSQVVRDKARTIGAYCQGDLTYFNQAGQAHSHNNGFGLASASAVNQEDYTNTGDWANVGSTSEFMFAGPCSLVGRNPFDSYIGLYDHDWRDASGSVGYTNSSAPELQLWQTSRPLTSSPTWTAVKTASYTGKHGSDYVGAAKSGSFVINQPQGLAVPLETTGWDFVKVKLDPHKIYKVKFNHIHDRSHIQVGLPRGHHGSNTIKVCPPNVVSMELDLSCQGLRLKDLYVPHRPEVAKLRLDWGRAGVLNSQLGVHTEKAPTNSTETILSYSAVNQLPKGPHRIYVTGYQLAGQTNFTDVTAIPVRGSMTHTKGSKTMVANDGHNFQLVTTDIDPSQTSSSVTDNHCLALEIELQADCSLKLTKLQLLGRDSTSAKYLRLDWGNSEINKEFEREYEALASYTTKPTIIAGNKYQALYKQLTTNGRRLDNLRYEGRYTAADTGRTSLIRPQVRGQDTALSLKITGAVDVSGQFSSFASLPPTLPNCGALPVEITDGCSIVAFNRTTGKIKVKLSGGLTASAQEVAINGQATLIDTASLKSSMDSDKTKTKDYSGVVVEYTTDVTGNNPSWTTAANLTLTVGSQDDCCYDTCASVQSLSDYQAAQADADGAVNTTPNSSYPALSAKPNPVTGTNSNRQTYYTGTRYPNTSASTVALKTSHAAAVTCGNPDSVTNLTGEIFQSKLTLDLNPSLLPAKPTGSSSISYNLRITGVGSAEPTKDAVISSNTATVGSLAAVSEGQIRGYGWAGVSWQITATQVYDYSYTEVWLEGGSEKTNSASGSFTETSTLTGHISCCTRVLLAALPTCQLRPQTVFKHRARIDRDSLTAPVWPLGVSDSRSQIVLTNSNPFSVQANLRHQTRVEANMTNGYSLNGATYADGPVKTIGNQTLLANGSTKVVNEQPTTINLPGFYEVYWGHVFGNDHKVKWSTNASDWQGTHYSSDSQSSLGCSGGSNKQTVYLSAQPPTCQLKFYHFEIGKPAKHKVVLTNPNQVALKIKGIKYSQGAAGSYADLTWATETLTNQNNQIAAGGSLELESSQEDYDETGLFHYGWQLEAAVGIENWTTDNTDSNNKALFAGTNSETIHQLGQTPSQSGCSTAQARVVHRPYYKTYYGGIAAGGRFGSAAGLDACDGGDSLLGWDPVQGVSGRVVGYSAGSGASRQGASADLFIRSRGNSIEGVYSSAINANHDDQFKLTGYGAAYGRCLPNLWRGYQALIKQGIKPSTVNSLELGLVHNRATGGQVLVSFNAGRQTVRATIAKSLADGPIWNWKKATKNTCNDNTNYSAAGGSAAGQSFTVTGIGSQDLNHYYCFRATDTNSSQHYYGGIQILDLTAADNQVYIISPDTGTLKLTRAVTDNLDIKATVYVDGDLEINSDIVNNRQVQWGSASEVGSIYLVARGDIRIKGNVSRLDAVLVALPERQVDPQKGHIFTCHYQDYPQTKGSLHWQECQRQLVVNGALLANQVHFGRTYGSVALAGTSANEERSQLSPTYCHSGQTDSLCAAEVVNLLPELFVAIPQLPTLADLTKDTDTRTYLPITH